MGWTSENFIDPQYTRKETLFIGCQTGCVKRLQTTYDKNAFMYKNLHDLAQLTKESRCTSLAFGDEQRKQLLLGRLNGSVTLCNLQDDGGCVEEPDKWSFKGPATIVNLLPYNDSIVAAMSNGELRCLPRDGENNTESEARIMAKTGDVLSRMRQCPTNKSIVATGGKERQNNLKVWDLSLDGCHQIFSSKNLPNDFLQLEVPIWDCDMGFLQASQHTLATCSRYGYVRVYDTRKQRRPILKYTSEKPQAFNSLSALGDYIYTGSTTGEIRAFDIRRMKNFIHTYRGAVGSISDLCLTNDGQFMVSTSLDRYIRIHDTSNCHLVYQCYVKSKPTHVLMVEEMVKDVAEVCESQSSQKDAPLAVDHEYEEIFSSMPEICENDHEKCNSKRMKRKISSTGNQQQNIKKSPK